MSDTQQNQHPEEPAEDSSDHKPLKAHLFSLLSFLTRWEVIGASACGLIAVLWSHTIGDSAIRDSLLFFWFVALLFLAAHKLAVNPLVRYWLPSLLCVCVAGGVYVFAYLDKKLDAPFTVVCMRFFRTPDRIYRPHFWILNKDYKTAYPAHIAMHLLFTNLKPIPVTVGHYQVETETTRGWERVRIIDVRRMSVVWPVAMAKEDTYVLVDGLYGPTEKAGLAGITNATVIHFTEGGLWDYEIVKPAEPNLPVIGMLFMEIPKSGIGTNWRFRIKDVNGTESVQPIRFSQETPRGDAPVHWLEWAFREDVDLTKMTRGYMFDR